MGGRIWVDSEVGRGSSFHFTVNLEIEHDTAAEEKPSELGLKQADRPLCVLLAEDNEINQQVAFEFLQMRGHQVRITGNGAEALAAFVKERFDVILMDVHMPKMDGFQATAAIREKEKTTGSRVPIIAMTGYAMKGDRQRCIDADMDGYICKPIRSQELYQAIESATAPDKNLKIDLAPLLLDNE
jgi:CheY-like chemotaxis protein